MLKNWATVAIIIQKNRIKVQKKIHINSVLNLKKGSLKTKKIIHLEIILLGFIFRLPFEKQKQNNKRGLTKTQFE